MQSFKKSLSAIVLAGGRSSRMGKDKALLPMGKQSLLSYVCNVAQESVNWVYIVTPWKEKYEYLVASSCIFVEETIVGSETESNSPLIGFYQGLQQVETEWVLLLACDLPRINSSAIQQWCSDLAKVPEGAIAFLPRHSKGWEPLCGFYRTNCLTELEIYIDSGGKSFQGWLRDNDVVELKIGDRSWLFNCNTPEDWLLINGDRSITINFGGVMM